MDVARVTELRGWGNRLEERGASEELRAAGKAIQLLVDEVEALQAKLVEAEAGAPPAEPPAEEPPPVSVPDTPSDGGGAEAEPAWRAADDRLHGSFLARVKKSLGFD